MPSLPPGFTGFDATEYVNDYVETPADKAYKEMTKRFGLMRIVGSEEILRGAGLRLTPSIYTKFIADEWGNAGGVWFAFSGKKTKQEAEAFGQTLWKSLIPLSKLPSDVPSMHPRDLYIGYGEGDLVVVPAPKKKVKPKTEPSLTEKKDALLKHIESVFKVTPRIDGGAKRGWTISFKLPAFGKQAVHFNTIEEGAEKIERAIGIYEKHVAPDIPLRGQVNTFIDSGELAKFMPAEG